MKMKNNNFGYLLSVVLIFGFAACRTANQPAKTIPLTDIRPSVPAAGISAVAGEYYGELPCADCEAITYHLVLKNDFSFNESSIYKGKSETPFVETGKWQLTGDGKVVLDKKSEKNQFSVEDNELIMLDREGNKIESAFADKYRLKKVAESDNLTFDLKKIEEGIDFIASGNGPSWSVEIDFEKSMKFTSMGEPAVLITPAVEGNKAADSNVTRYHALVESGELSVTLIKQPCTDNMSGEERPYSVSVDVKTSKQKEFTNYKGCGRFTSDYRLNDIWIVVELNGKVLKAEEFMKEPPTFEFHLKESKLYGSGGCNRINGPIEVQGNSIFFGMFAMTMMACPNMEVETELMKTISKNTLGYSVENGKLILLKEGKPAVVLKKVD
jgi:heat shock protein HslJ/uncharacterized membrane protein/uncharacterized lipoprotein NlpE involved in copper resistance